MALTPGIIAAIVAAAVIVLAGAAFLCFKPKKKRSDTEAVYQVRAVPQSWIGCLSLDASHSILSPAGWRDELGVSY